MAGTHFDGNSAVQTLTGYRMRSRLSRDVGNPSLTFCVQPTIFGID
jgi:hypothetical protein